MRLSTLVLLLVLMISTSTCVKRERSPQAFQSPSLSATQSTQPKRININTASANELEALPGIGKALAERIIEHRDKYGPFRKPEHLIIVRGISEKRFQNLRDLITVE